MTLEGPPPRLETFRFASPHPSDAPACIDAELAPVLCIDPMVDADQIFPGRDRTQSRAQEFNGHVSVECTDRSGHELPGET